MIGGLLVFEFIEADIGTQRTRERFFDAVAEQGLLAGQFAHGGRERVQCRLDYRQALVDLHEQASGHPALCGMAFREIGHALRESIDSFEGEVAWFAHIGV